MKTYIILVLILNFWIVCFMEIILCISCHLSDKEKFGLMLVIVLWVNEPKWTLCFAKVLYSQSHTGICLTEVHHRTVVMYVNFFLKQFFICLLRMRYSIKTKASWQYVSLQLNKFLTIFTVTYLNKVTRCTKRNVNTFEYSSSSISLFKSNIKN